MQEPVTLRGRAKKMRSEMTQPERELWMQLRGKRFAGVKFYRQFIIEPFIVDFAARAERLVVEIDGDTHDDPAKDARRTAVIERHGYRVVRFTNGEVMTNIEGVLLTIAAALGRPVGQSLSQTSIGSAMPPAWPEQRGALFTRCSLKGEGLSA